jgi:hypothetical protein
MLLKRRPPLKKSPRVYDPDNTQLSRPWGRTVVLVAHPERSVDETSANQTVRHIAARGDRARRVSVADGRLTRFGLPVAAGACLVSALAPVLGWPPASGLFLLGAGAIAAGVTALSARRARSISDDVVAELDRAADLGGSLRSAHWFAAGGTPVAQGSRTAPWIAFHLEDAASRAAHVNWTRVYERPPARLSWGLTLLCVLATMALSARPLPRRPTRPLQSSDAARAAVQSAPSTADALVPEVFEGMRAMRSGRTPSQEQLTAIGKVLAVAKNNTAAQRQIEGQLTQSGPRLDNPLSAPDSDGDTESSADDAHDGFELADLDWAYQEALARAQGDERTRPDSSAEAIASEGRRDGQAGEGGLEHAASGALTDVPVEGDAQGQAASFSSLLVGRPQASGDAGSTAPPQSPSRAAALAAALRSEVVHARSDVDGPNLDLLNGPRRGTNPGQTPSGAVRADHVVRYDRSRAMQPPAVPDARRSLVHDVFLRPAEAASPVKRP